MRPIPRVKSSGKGGGASGEQGGLVASAFAVGGVPPPPPVPPAISQSTAAKKWQNELNLGPIRQTLLPQPSPPASSPGRSPLARASGGPVAAASDAAFPPGRCMWAPLSHVVNLLVLPRPTSEYPRSSAQRQPNRAHWILAHHPAEAVQGHAPAPISPQDPPAHRGRASSILQSLGGLSGLPPLPIAQFVPGQRLPASHPTAARLHTRQCPKYPCGPYLLTGRQAASPTSNRLAPSLGGQAEVPPACRRGGGSGQIEPDGASLRTPHGKRDEGGGVRGPPVSM